MKTYKNNFPRVTFLFCVVAVILVMAIFAVRSAADAPSQAEKDSLKMSAKLLSMDLDENYPESPVDLLNLNNEFIMCLYGGHSDDDTVRELVLKQRGLFAQELLALNPRDDALEYAVSQIALMTESGLNVLSVSTGEPVYPPDEPTVCFVTVTEYMTLNTEDILDFTLIKENSKWKIYRFDFKTKNQPGP